MFLLSSKHGFQKGVRVPIAAVLAVMAVMASSWTFMMRMAVGMPAGMLSNELQESIFKGRKHGPSAEGVAHQLLLHLLVSFIKDMRIKGGIGLCNAGGLHYALSDLGVDVDEEWAVFFEVIADDFLTLCLPFWL